MGNDETLRELVRLALKLGWTICVEEGEGPIQGVVMGEKDWVEQFDIAD